jgi:hypothetical protein
VAQPLADRLRDLHQYAVAGGVPERVVELLEAVQIDQQHGAVGVLARHAPLAIDGSGGYRHPPHARAVADPDDEIAVHLAAAERPHRRLRVKRQRRAILGQQLQAA